MNLNNFVVLPHNKARSLKLNTRNMQELRSKMGSVALMNNDLEERLQELKESMRQEKEKRRLSVKPEWKSGQRLDSFLKTVQSQNLKSAEHKFQKLSDGKIKIRVLKDKTQTDETPPQTPPQPPSSAPRTAGPRTAKKARTRCGACSQCRVKSAGLACVECAADFCLGCFTSVHQKGALKLHRMRPYQAETPDRGSGQEAAGSSNTHSRASSRSSPAPPLDPTPRDQDSPTGPEDGAGFLHSSCSQVLVVHAGEEGSVMYEQRTREAPSSLLGGDFDEDQSARSFQEALRRWREDQHVGEGAHLTQEAMRSAETPVSVSAMETQTELPAEGVAAAAAGGREDGGAGGRRTPVRAGLRPNNLSYMDRLLLKKLRRTQMEASSIHQAESPSPFQSILSMHPEDDADGSLSAQEENFRRYCASLFAFPTSSSRSEPQTTSPESCLLVEVMNETDRDINGVFVAEQTADNNNTKTPSVQQVSGKVRAPVAQAASVGGGPSGAGSAPAPAELHGLKQPPTLPEHSIKVASPKSSPPTSPAPRAPPAPPASPAAAATATGTRGTSKVSMKTSPPKPLKPAGSASPRASKTNRAEFLSSPSLPRSGAQTPEAGACSGPRLPASTTTTTTSISLRSTFTLSPSTSTDSTLLPKVYQSRPLAEGCGARRLQPSPLFPKPISSQKLPRKSQSNLCSPKQSQRSSRDPDSFLSDNQAHSPSSAVSPRLPRRPPEPGNPSLSKCGSEAAPPDASSRYTLALTPWEAPISVSGIRESTARSPRDAGFVLEAPSPRLDSSWGSPSAAEEEEEEEEEEEDKEEEEEEEDHDDDEPEEDEDEYDSDSAGEMSSDSLEPSDDNAAAATAATAANKEPAMHGRLAAGRSPQESGGSCAPTHQEDCFVPADAERGIDCQPDGAEQLSEASTLCDPDGFSPPGSDSGQSSRTGSARCDWDPAGGQRPSRCSSSSGPSLHAGDGRRSGIRREDHEPESGVGICSTSPRRRGGISADESGTSGLWSSLSDGSASPPPCVPRAGAPPKSAPWPMSERRRRRRRRAAPSRTALEILEVCHLDRAHCDDPELDADTAAHILHDLEEECRLMAKGAHTLAVAMGNGGSQRGNHGKGVSQARRDKDKVAQMDQHSVLLLP